jgi:hypothetical protein
MGRYGNKFSLKLAYQVQYAGLISKEIGYKNNNFLIKKKCYSVLSNNLVPLNVLITGILLMLKYKLNGNFKTCAKF